MTIGGDLLVDRATARSGGRLRTIKARELVGVPSGEQQLANQEEEKGEHKSSPFAPNMPASWPQHRMGSDGA
jgi:hypothetical protein